MERFHTLVFGAGIACFAIAFVLSMIFPWMSLYSYHGMEFHTLAELAETPGPAFADLAARYPESFRAAYGDVSPASYAEALQRGRDIYVGQACWHCHSQYVRVVAHEAERWGPPSTAQEYQNALNLPHLWGTRRVGPDLAREGGRRTNDWHVAHFMNPRSVVPSSVMPAYPFYFDEHGVPDRDGIALITYLQWLGTVNAANPTGVIP
jgi:hypothetical protein